MMTTLIPRLCNRILSILLFASISFNLSANDNKAAATLLNHNEGCSANAAYTSIGATGDESAGACWVNGPNYNRWFKFVATTTDVQIDVKVGGSEGTMRYVFASLWTDGGTELACKKYVNATSDVELHYTGLTVSETYFISVDNYNGSIYQGTFTLCVANAITNNDHKPGATTLSDLDDFCSANQAYTTIGGTADESAGSCWFNGPNYNRWFKFTATDEAIKVTLKTGGSKGTMRYPFLTLWDNTLTEIDCDVYTSIHDNLEVLSVTLTPGNDYFISVDNYFGANYAGTFTLCITDDVGYDYKVSAETIAHNAGCSSNGQYSTEFGTPDESKGACADNGPNYNHWFKFTATTTDVEIELRTGGAEGTLRYPFLSLWTAGGTELACKRYSEPYDDMKIQHAGLTVSNDYYISVDNYFGVNYKGSFTLCIDDNITYDSDNQLGATVLAHNVGCSANGAYTTVGGTADQSAGSCWVEGPNYNKWFKFTATSTSAHINLKVGGAEGSMRYPYLALWDNTLTQLNCVSYNTPTEDLEIINESLTVSNDYYISVDNYSGAQYWGTFTLCLDDAIAFNNDHKDGAQVLTDFSDWCSPLATYTTFDGSADDAAASCWYNGPNYNKWYKFTAPSTGISIKVKTGGSYGNMRYAFVGLWDNASTQIACDVYSSPYDSVEILATNLIQGNDYYIAVDNYFGKNYKGSFTLCIDELSNDYVAGAVTLAHNAGCSALDAYSNANASADESKGSCWDNGPNENVWFKFVATTTEVHAILKMDDGVNDLEYPYIALYDDNLTELDCKRYYDEDDSIEILYEGLTVSETYYIAVDNFDNVNYPGNFGICLFDNITWTYDYYQGAIEFTDLNDFCSTDAAYTSFGASADQAKGSCWDHGPTYNRWFKFTATTTEIEITMKTGGSEGSLRYPFLALWDDGLTELSCARFTGPNSDITIQNSSLSIGNTYYISADHWFDSDYCCTFSMCISDDIVPKHGFEPGHVWENQEPDAVLNDRSIVLYPNPTQDQVFLQYRSFRKLAAEIDLVVHDIYGKELFRQTGTTVQPDDQLKIDLNGIAAGIYFMVITSANRDEQVVKKLVVQ